MFVHFCFVRKIRGGLRIKLQLLFSCANSGASIVKNEANLVHHFLGAVLAAVATIRVSILIGEFRGIIGCFDLLLH